MANESGSTGPDETPANPVPPSRPGELPTMPIPSVRSGSGPDLPALETSFGDTEPTIPLVPPYLSRPHLENLSPRERGVAPPRGLSGTTRNLRITLIALGVLLLGACSALSWGAAGAFFPPPGAPIAVVSTATSGSPTSSSAGASASATDQLTATVGGTPTATGGNSSPTPGASPTDTPTPSTPTHTPTPTATPCPAPYNNPWGYNFCTPGSLITGPTPNAFCSVFPCASNYSQSGPGYVVECVDGRFSHGGGFAGACKFDGKVIKQPLYQHP